ncbi:hypothetical protein FBQ99_21380 [Chloroflexi bacterium CFX2]|nr:hypothetical protein [Chloroflexi bacterium CFX2]
MNNPNFIRLSGWAFIIGAFCFYMFFPLYYLNSLGVNVGRVVAGWGISYDLSFYASPFVLAIGMFGLWARYGEIVGKLGKIILLISPVGILISQYGLTQASIYEQEAFVSVAGLVVLLTCLTLFGVLALISKPLPRWNGLPIIAGVGFPAIFLYSSFAWTDEASMMNQFALVVLVVTIQFIALVALGYILQGDVIKEARSHPREQTA